MSCCKDALQLSIHDDAPRTQEMLRSDACIGHERVGLEKNVILTQDAESWMADESWKGPVAHLKIRRLRRLSSQPLQPGSQPFREGG